MCAAIPTLPQRGELVVFNPLTGENRALPPLLYPRNPVLVHLIVDSEQRSFKVVVAGSSAYYDMHLSQKVEVFDSSTSKWTEACELPGPEFGVNEIQAGVCLNGKLFVIAYLETNSDFRGVIAFDVEKGKWLMDRVCPIPLSLLARILQLVESNGKVYLFTQVQMNYGRHVELCIDELDFPDLDARSTEEPLEKRGASEEIRLARASIVLVRGGRQRKALHLQR